MEPEDIKVGDCYPVLAHVGYTNKKGNYGITINWGDGLMETRILTPDDACAMFSIYETKPKYDPCRLFKKGDKVRVKREVHGRPVYISADAWDPLDPDEEWEVEEEKETGWICLKNGCLSADVWHGMLELVTPVEELEPYSVEESTDYFSVDKGEEEQDEPFKVTHNPRAKQFEVIAITPDMTPMYIIPYSTAINAHKNYRIETARARAEAECARLNAEYRKEQNNGLEH